jgi:hypothetical protein
MRVVPRVRPGRAERKSLSHERRLTDVIILSAFPLRSYSALVSHTVATALFHFGRCSCSRMGWGWRGMASQRSTS